ncbi:hypothetical protein O3795_07310 [Haemophilus parahaemolyticus]|nr:hypothetical protein [Haemophilus parahaemolyticus]
MNQQTFGFRQQAVSDDGFGQKVNRVACSTCGVNNAIIFYISCNKFSL